MKQMPMENPSIAKVRKDRAWFRRDWSLYLMAAPGLVFFLVLSYIPMLFLIVAFQDFKIGLGVWGSPFVGFENFTQLFNDFMFPQVLKNTLILNLLKIFICFPVPIMLAICFNEMRPSRYKGTLQSLVYLPHFLSWIIIYGIMNSLFNTSSGLVNQLLEALGQQPVAFLSSSSLYRPIMVISEIWKEAGWSSIIYIAALAGISPELYEAAVIDGANKWRRIWHISLPGIRDTMVILFVLSTGSLLSNSFEQVYVTMNSAVQDVAEIIPTYVYDKGLVNFKISYATTVGLFQSVIGCVLVIASNMVAKKFGGNTLW